jgi:PAS domain S-box-containing protein
VSLVRRARVALMPRVGAVALSGVAVDEQRPPITAVPFPSDDVVFAARVREALREVEGHPVAEAMDHVKGRLRPVHPEIETHRRSDIAGYGTAPVVYVFRDGMNRHTFSDDWIDATATARVVTDPQGTYLDANDEAGRLFGVNRDQIIGCTAGSFTKPDARIEDAAELWTCLERLGRLHSLAVIQRPDGTETTVEFVTVKNGDGLGRNVTALRATGDGRPSANDAL